jgi:hypothetical protein
VIAEPETTQRVRIWTEPVPRCPDCRRPLALVQLPMAHLSAYVLACVGLAAGDGSSCGWRTTEVFRQNLRPDITRGVIAELIDLHGLKHR